MESSPAATLLTAGVARASDLGHGRGHGGHWSVAEVLPRRVEASGGHGKVQRDDGVDSGGEQRPASRVRGFSARLELGLGVFESWENREPNARTEAPTGALERGGRRQWRLQSSALMAYRCRG